MKKLIFSCLLLFLLGHCLAQELPDYTPLDVADPVVFKGTYLVYDGDTVVLGARAFFVDGQLSDEVVARYDFVFNSVNEARSEEHTSELQSRPHLVCRLLLEKKKKKQYTRITVKRR